MSEFKGTPSPWMVTIPENSNGFLYVGKHHGDFRIATCYTVDNKSEEDCITDETKANAQLIAHAPQMLEMLKDIKDCLESGNSYDVVEVVSLHNIAHNYSYYKNHP